MKELKLLYAFLLISTIFGCEDDDKDDQLFFPGGDLPAEITEFRAVIEGEPFRTDLDESQVAWNRGQGLELQLGVDEFNADFTLTIDGVAVGEYVMTPTTLTAAGVRDGFGTRNNGGSGVVTILENNGQIVRGTFDVTLAVDFNFEPRPNLDRLRVTDGFFEVRAIE